MPDFRPSYIRLYETGVLQERIDALLSRLESCDICPRRCGVDRTAGLTGICKVGDKPMVSSYNPHFGEEPPLVGRFGSGTIFLTYCNLNCVFCQNFDISHLGSGSVVSTDELASMMVELQRKGCHNINFVTPTHQIAQIVESLPSAIDAGLEIPLVYNTGGYDSVDTIKLLDGIFDIYMPDLKYGDNESARLLSNAGDYLEVSKAAVKEMHRQVGELELDPTGVATRGLIVRHLVLPAGLAGTREVMSFIARELSIDTYVNIMDQYRPCYKAVDNKCSPEIGRRITAAEFEEALDIAREEGVTRLA